VPRDGNVLRFRHWVIALVAVLAGNAIYYWLLVPRLSSRWEHRPFALDRGLLLDFGCCLAIYLAWRIATARGR
jgi:hypothetical protein